MGNGVVSTREVAKFRPQKYCKSSEIHSNTRTRRNRAATARRSCLALASMDGTSFFIVSSKFQLSLKWSRLRGCTRSLAVDDSNNSCKPRNSTAAFCKLCRQDFGDYCSAWPILILREQIPVNLISEHVDVSRDGLQYSFPSGPFTSPGHRSDTRTPHGVSNLK